jgi:hypothetical protein
MRWAASASLVAALAISAAVGYMHLEVGKPLSVELLSEMFRSAELSFKELQALFESEEVWGAAAANSTYVVGVWGLGQRLLAATTNSPYVAAAGGVAPCIVLTLLALVLLNIFLKRTWKRLTAIKKKVA